MSSDQTHHSNQLHQQDTHMAIQADLLLQRHSHSRSEHTNPATPLPNAYPIPAVSHRRRSRKEQVNIMGGDIHRELELSVSQNPSDISYSDTQGLIPAKESTSTNFFYNKGGRVLHKKNSVKSLSLGQLDETDAQESANSDSEGFDPLQHLNYLEKVEFEYTMASNKITPFNQSNYIQVMFNPQTTTREDAADKDELITVQVFKPAVKLNTNQPKKVETRPRCLKDHYLVGACNYTDQTKQCTTCPSDDKGTPIEPNQNGFKCPAGCDFWLCQNCTLKFYQRRKLVKQTSKHALYDLYHLSAVSNKRINNNSDDEADKDKESEQVFMTRKAADILENQNNDGVESDKQKPQSRQDKIRALETRQHDFQMSNKNVTTQVINFADVKPQHNLLTKRAMLKKFVLISFWRLVGDQYRAYRMFVVDRPAFLNITSQDPSMKNQRFLHLTKDNQIFFFTKKQRADSLSNEYDIILNRMDMQRALDPDDRQLEMIQASTYKAPLYRIRTFTKRTSKVYQLFQRLLVFRDTRRVVVTCGLCMQQIRGKEMLIVSAPLAWKKHENQKRPDPEQMDGEWIVTNYKNIIFIETSSDPNKWRVAFTIYDAELFLESFTYRGNVESIMFFRSRDALQDKKANHIETATKMSQIVEMPFGSPIIKKQGADWDEPPEQPIIKAYNILPRKNDTNYIVQMEEMYKLLKKCDMQNLPTEGVYHPTRKTAYQRVSVIYQAGGIFTFELRNKQSYTKGGSFSGYMGYVRNFHLKQFRIQNEGRWVRVVGEGHDERGEFFLEGDLEVENKPWHGWRSINSSKMSNNIQVMSVQEVKIQNNAIQGYSYALTDHDQRKVLVLQGKINEDDSVVFEFIESKQRAFICIGKIDQDRFEMSGKYYIKDEYMEDSEPYGEFLIHIEAEVLISNAKITYGSNAGIFVNEQIELKGLESESSENKYKQSKPTLDVLRGVLSGRFQSSKILERFFGTDSRFELVCDVCQDQAATVFQSTDNKDAQFCRVISMTGGKGKTLNEVYACGNLSIKTKTQANERAGGYNPVEFELLDLDMPEVEFQNRHKKIITCQVPKNFRVTSDEKDNLVKPFYRLLPFKVYVYQQNDSSVAGNPLSSAYLSFRSQMFYRDSLQNNTKILFLHGLKKLVSKTNDSPKLKRDKVLPQWPPIMTENYTIYYPLLAYKSNLPTDNELVIVNLATNEPQMYIDLEPYRFVQFVDTGMIPEKYIDPQSDQLAINTQILFLVEHKGKLYLMNYKVFPWPISFNWTDENQKLKFQEVPQIQLFSGCIDWENYTDDEKLGKTNQLTAEKMISASLLQRVQSDGVQVVIVVQLLNEIVVFNLNRPDFFSPLNRNKTKMLKLKMQTGPDNQIYYAEKNEHGMHQIVQLTFVNRDEISRKPVFISETDQILALQIEDRLEFGLVADNSHLLFILMSNRVFKRIVISGSREETQIVVSDIDLGFNLKFQKMFSLLKQNHWSSLVLNEIGIIALEAGQNSNELLATRFSTQSEMMSFHKFLGFADDRKLATLKKGRNYNRENNCSVLSVGEIPWIDKHIFEIVESNKSYFLVMQHTAEKHIDMMRIDTQRTILQDVKIIGNVYIAVKLMYTNQYLLYKQSDQTFYGIYDSSNLINLTAVCNGEQFFLSQPSVKTEPMRLVKITNAGKFINIFDPKSRVIESIYDFIEKFLYDQDDAQFQADFSTQYVSINPETDQVSFFIFVHNERSMFDIEEDEPAEWENDCQYKFLGRKCNFTSFTVDLSRWAGLDQTENLPNIYIFTGPQFDDPTAHKQIISTQDYLIVKYDKKVFFAKKEEVERDHQPIQVTKDSPVHVQRVRDKLKNPSGQKVQFGLIDLGRLQPNQKKYGVNIIPVEKQDVNTVEKAEDRDNTIQITMKDLALIWDLDEHKEVLFLNKMEEFDTSITYIVTGFKPYLHGQKTAVPDMNNALFFQQNENRSLLLTPRTHDKKPVLFRLYTLINMVDVFDLQEKERKSLYVDKIDEQTMLQNFNGLTPFQIFQNNADFVTFLLDKIKDDRLQDEVNRDEKGETTDNLLIRHIYWTLNKPIVEINEEEKHVVKRPSIIQVSMFHDVNQHMLDHYLRLIYLSRERKISNLIANFDCFKQVFDIQSNENEQFLAGSFIQNSITREVKSMQWNQAHSMITFGTQYSQLTADDIRQEVNGEQLKRLGNLRKLVAKLGIELPVLKTYPVSVKIIEIEWLSESLVEFYGYLADKDETAIFGNDFLTTLLEQQQYSNQLVIKIFLPFLVNMILQLSYYSYYVPSVPVTQGFFGVPDEMDQGAFRIIIIGMSLFFLLIELRQLYKAGLVYFLDFWNYVYLIGYSLAIVIILAHGLQVDYPPHYLVMVSSLAIVYQYVMLFYWMRLFKNLAFYVTMIVETISDISYFMAIYLLSILCFGNALYCLNQIVVIQYFNEDRPLQNLAYIKATEIPFVDSFLHIYRISLGDFDTDRYTAHPAAKWIWSYFFLATLLTQVMFLNMLIAIMGDTFSRVNNKKDVNALKERTKMYADFLWAIRLTEELKDQRYLYVVRPLMIETEETDQIEQTEKKILQIMKSEFSKTSEEISVLKNKMSQLVTQQNSMQQDINEKFAEILKHMKARPNLP